MNYRLVIENLDTWTKEELFFKEFYEAKQQGRSVKELVKKTEADRDEVENALNPDRIETKMSEEKFFQAGRNAMLIKHPRYYPFFTHQHVFFEMIYVLRGKCIEITNDREAELHTGDICLLAPNVTHGLKCFEDSVVINLLIRYSTFQDIFLNAIRDKSQLSMFFTGNLYEKRKIRYLLYHTDGDEMIRNYILDMYLEQLHKDEYSDRMICSFMTIFFTQLTRMYGRSVEIPDIEDQMSENGRLMINYIINNYSTVSLNMLAKYFHYSVPYCSKIIKEVSGNTFSELLTNIRLQQGENLLSHTQLSIADISDKLGYKNPETFIRAFMRVYHMSPTQYRRK